MKDKNIMKDKIEHAIERGYLPKGSALSSYKIATNLRNQIITHKILGEGKKELSESYHVVLAEELKKYCIQAEKVIGNLVSTGVTLKQIRFLYTKGKERGGSLI